jgi:hypothetical protein
MSGKKIILKKLKQLNTIWHPESTLVFKSRDEKIVIGKFADEQYIELDDDAVSLCEEWGFKFDETLLANKEDEHQSDEEQTDEDDEDPPDEGEQEEPPDETEEEQEEPPDETEEEQEEPPDETEEEQEEPTQITKTPSDTTHVEQLPSEEGTDKELKMIQGILWKLYIDVSAANCGITQKHDAMKAEIDKLRKENDTIKKERDSMSDKLNNLKSLLS